MPISRPPDKMRRRSCKLEGAAPFDGLGSRRCLVPSNAMCSAQEWNVIERVTKLLGILPGSFAVAKTMKAGAAIRQLSKALEKVIIETLVVRDEEPPACRMNGPMAGVALQLCCPWLQPTHSMQAPVVLQKSRTRGPRR